MSGQNNDAEPPPQVPGHILRSLRRQQRRQPGLRRAGPRHPRLLRPRHRGQQGEDGLPPTVTTARSAQRDPPRLVLEVGGTSTLQAAVPVKLKSPPLQGSK